MRAILFLSSMTALFGIALVAPTSIPYWGWGVLLLVATFVLAYAATYMVLRAAWDWAMAGFPVPGLQP